MTALRKGQSVDVPVTLRIGPNSRAAQVATPCCGVVYRIALSEIDYCEKTNNLVSVTCGKKRGRRGRHGNGCLWPYTLTFTRDEADTITGSTWKV